VAIISGVGPGHGQQLASVFAEHGAQVVLAARTETYLRQIAAEIESTGGEASWCATDITDRGACERLVAHAVERWGGVDCLVHNAYDPYPFAPFPEVDLQDWHHNMEVNLFGALNLTQAALPMLRHRSGASVVFVNSLIAKRPYPMQGGYAASKGALASAARMLALELAPLGIRVNTLYVGWMWGPPVEQHLRGVAEERGVGIDVAMADIVRAIPLGRIPDDRECANAAVFFASDLSSAITGAGLDVNGGELMG
jgi:NAD(P)-dependent dehydrogenase (short-subunit alcohol dehydrogenase family)